MCEKLWLSAFIASGFSPRPKGVIALACLFSIFILGSSKALAAPGDILFSEDFDAGGGTCNALAPSFTTSSTILSGVNTLTSNSASCSLFTRGDAVEVESATFDLSSTTGAQITAWVRQGADAFSEDPEASDENLILEYIDSTGFWIFLEEFSATGLTPGTIVNVNTTMPLDGLHGAAQIRFRQLGGDGGPPANGGLGFDFWHIDDVVVTETGTPPPIPNPDLTANSCDDFEDNLDNWSVSSGTMVGINNDTANSPSQSLFLRHGIATATSIALNTGALQEVTVFVQRGSDAFSENPDAGENLVLEFLDSSNNFIELETFTGTGTQGEVFNRTYTATPAMRHANFRLRIRTTGGNGPDFDYWHIDDVCLVSGTPSLAVVKTVSIESDPVSGTSGPYAIPGAIARYAITVSNSGDGVVDADTIFLTDDLSDAGALFVGDLDGGGSPFIFIDGTGADASGISLDFGGLGDGSDGVVFRNDSGSIITPTALFDETVGSFEITFEGTMNSTSGGGTPTFTIEYEIRVK